MRGALVRLALVAAAAASTAAGLLNKGLAGFVTDRSTAVPRSAANPSTLALTPAPGSLLESVGIALVRAHHRLQAKRAISFARAAVQNLECGRDISIQRRPNNPPPRPQHPQRLLSPAPHHASPGSSCFPIIIRLWHPQPSLHPREPFLCGPLISPRLPRITPSAGAYRQHGTSGFAFLLNLLRRPDTSPPPPPSGTSLSSVSVLHPSLATIIL